MEDLTLSDRRRLYECQDKFVTLSNIPTWKESSVSTGTKTGDERYSANEELNEKISIFRGNLTTLEIDAVVNTGNQTLIGSLDSRTVDHSIHAAAGAELHDECLKLGGCEKGQAKITHGHRLPAKYVIHTVGPRGEQPDVLRSCYENCFQLMKQNRLTKRTGLKSIAFPCISTGKLGYPSEEAAHIALGAAREFLERDNNAKEVDRIIFCLFSSSDFDTYERLMHKYFPSEAEPVEAESVSEVAGQPPPRVTSSLEGSIPWLLLIMVAVLLALVAGAVLYQ